jgi:hypothetical protein
MITSPRARGIVGGAMIVAEAVKAVTKRDATENNILNER